MRKATSLIQVCITHFWNKIFAQFTFHYFSIGEDVDHANVIFRTGPRATYMVLAGDVGDLAAKFLVWENTTRKKLQPLELTSKLTTEFPITAPLGDCIKNVIFELTIWHYKRSEMHVKDAIATKQNVTLWANWRSRRSRYKRIQL